MEKYKTIILIEKIKKCLEIGKCEEALVVAESIDKKKLKNMSDISIVAECYFQNGKYEEAKELFMRIYEKTHSRRIVAQLVHLSIKLKDTTDANHYLSEFIQIAPQDFYRYIFQYSIDKMTKAPIVKLIEDLEGLKKAEYIESWAYELAKLYHKASLKDKCVAECNDIVLWFGSGDYVERAKALRSYYLGELDQSVFGDLENVAGNVAETVSDTETESETDIDESNESTEELASVSEKEEVETVQGNEEVLDEDEISAALAHEIDDMFEDSGEVKESLTESTTDEPQSEDDFKINDVIESENQADTVKQDEVEIPMESVEQDEVENQTETVEQNEVEKLIETKESEPDAADEEDEVEKEVYRILKEEDGIDLSRTTKTETKEVVQSSPNDVEEVQQETMNLSLDQEVEEPQKQTTKMKIKELPNDQLVGEDQEDLLTHLDQNDIKLSELFGNFIRMESVQKQIIRSLDQALNQMNDNINMIVTGPSKTGKTRLGKCIAKVLNRMHLIQSNKVALISATTLNEIDLMEKKEQLTDCVVIIEHAGELSKEKVKSLQEIIKALPNRVIFILEDTRENMNRLLRQNNSLNSIFNNRIHLPKYSLEDYMGFAYEYFTEKEYEIEMPAYIALQNQFQELMKKTRENALTAIFSYLDTIIQKSEKRSTSQLLAMSQTGHYEDSELMVLKCEDIVSTKF